MIHNDPLLNFFQFRINNAIDSVNDIWGAIWIVVVSEIWKHMNNVILKGGVVDVLELFAIIQVNVWSRITSKSHSIFFSYSDWCIDHLVCMRLVTLCITLLVSTIVSFRGLSGVLLVVRWRVLACLGEVKDYFSV